MIVDTGALLAFFNADEPAHAAVVEALTTSTDPLVVSPYVVAELDYLVATRYGVRAELAVLRELSGGAWDLPAVDGGDLSGIIDVIERHSDQAIGVADASNVLLAARYGTRTIATLDRRHFDVLRSGDGGPFTVVP